MKNGLESNKSLDMEVASVSAEDEWLTNRVNGEHVISNTEALIHLIKGLVGTGILSMAAGYYYAGLWTGLILTPIVIGLNVHTMKTVVRLSHYFCVKTKTHSLDYGTVAELCMMHGPKNVQRYSDYLSYTNFSRISVNVLLVVTQLGFCCTYIAFTAQNIKQIVDAFSNAVISIYGYIAMVTVPLLFAVVIRHLKHISFISVFGNVVYVTGFAITFYYIFSTLSLQHTVPAFNSFKTLPLAFGIIMFAFEAVSLILPIENKMKNPKELVGTFGVLNCASLLVLALYCAVGFFGYLRFGAEVQVGTITLNLPQKEILYVVVKLLFCLAIYFTYVLQFFVPVELFMDYADKKYSEHPKKRLIVEYAVRFGTLFFTFAMAELIPHVDLFVSLIGSISCSALTLIIPPIMEMCFVLTIERPERNSTLYLIISKDVVLIAIGLIGSIAGTYSSISMIIQSFHNH